MCWYSQLYHDISSVVHSSAVCSTASTAPTSNQPFCVACARTGEDLRFAVVAAVGVGVTLPVPEKYDVRSTGFADGDGEHECEIDLTLDCEEALLPMPGREGRMESMEGFRVRPVMVLWLSVGRGVEGSCAVPESECRD
jgi:hypothetical protein